MQLASEIRKLVQEASQLKSEKKRLSAQHDAERTVAQQEIDRLRKISEAQADEILRLRAQLSSGRDSVSNSLEKAREEVEKLRKELEDLHSCKDELDGAWDLLESLKVEIDDGDKPRDPPV
jgi:chromosome segregation ATPase